MLVNLTNHPYSEWGEQQREAARCYGECVDIPFPMVPPDANAREVELLADSYFDRIIQLDSPEVITVHIMGEQTFCYALISKLLRAGVPCVASCTARDVTVMEDGSKQVRFHFSRFRPYVAMQA